MLVFGDQRVMERPRTALSALADDWRATGAWRASDAAARRLDLYVDAARLAQGCVDAQFEAAGADALTPLHRAALAMLRGLAQEIRDEDLATPAAPSNIEARNAANAAAIHAFAALAPDEALETRVAEGFSFYALDPRAWRGAPQEKSARADVVIGLRSAGMALAPALALELGAACTLTLRPVGHPYARRLRLHPCLRTWLAAHAAARFAIVDEGPGLSGSSFGAVADLLEELGVAPTRIAFHPSHAGEPGAQASAAHRARWRLARRHPLPQSRAPWSARETIDLGAGRWRAFCATPDAPADCAHERAKILLREESETHVARFSGFGALGQWRVEAARRLAQAGHAPEVTGARFGWLHQAWVEGAPAEALPREALIARIADYLAFRAQALAPPPVTPTSLTELARAARYNMAQALGESAAQAAFAPFEGRVARLAALERPGASDNRMQAHEWIVDARGALLKLDAIDHCASHDLVGPRDLAWDVAGAIVEFDLDDGQARDLRARLVCAGTPATQELLAFFLTVYCAFRLGAALMAAQTGAQDDARGWRAAAARYAARLTPPARFRSDGAQPPALHP